MLIHFKVSNYKSFKNTVTLNMQKGRAKLKENHVINRNNLKLLRSAIVYGANASGKSNLINAVSFAKDLIIGKIGKVNESLNVPSFMWKTGKPISFEFGISLPKRNVRYGFSIKDGYIYEEYLFQMKAKVKEDKMIFKRTASKKNSFIFAKKNERKKLIAENTPKNILFIRQTILNNYDEFKDVYDWINEQLIVFFTDTTLCDTFSFSPSDPLYKTRINFIKNVDVGIEDIVIKQLNESEIEKLIGKRLFDKVKTIPEGDSHLLTNVLDYTIVSKKKGILTAERIVSKHNGETFSFNDESEGTRRIFDFLPIFIRKDDGKPITCLVDEIERSLHIDLLTSLLRLFFENKSESQLIATTHQNSLLNTDVFRFDEIWIFNKSREGVSIINSLDEYKYRYDKNIEKAYRAGRFGGIPIINTINLK